MPKSMGSKGEPIAVWDIPCQVGNDSKAIKGTGFAIQIKDTGGMSNLSRQGPKDSAKDARASRHYNGMVARLELMLMEQGLTEDEAEYHARFPFQRKDKDAKAAVQDKLEEWYSREAEDINKESDTETNEAEDDFTEHDHNTIEHCDVNSADIELPDSESSNPDHGEHESKAPVDPSHGPFTQDIDFYPLPADWQDEVGMPSACRFSDEELCDQWSTAFRSSDLNRLGTDKIPETLFELVPLFALLARTNIDRLMVWQVRIIYKCSTWYSEQSIDNLCNPLQDLSLHAERWAQRTAPAGYSAGDSIGDDDMFDEEDTMY